MRTENDPPPEFLTTMYRVHQKSPIFKTGGTPPMVLNEIHIPYFKKFSSYFSRLQYSKTRCIIKKMPPQLLISKDTLATIGTYILNGMSEKEACILADVAYADLQDQKEVSEVTRNYLEKKRTEFKYNHLKEIQKSKSEKNSQWMLEKIFPEEFGSRPRQTEGPTVNIISAIIQDIQNDNGNNIVRFNRQQRETIKDDTSRIIEGSSLLN